MDIAKQFAFEEVEAQWVRAWEESGAFRADPTSAAAPFCIVIPPPNVTGNLHIGHVLVYTLHDIVARWRRMQGRDVLWLPGTDHAGIATQMVVERELAKEGLSRHDLGRQAFEARVWQWKETYGGSIVESLRQLGCSCDWSRSRFTLDDGLSRAVRAVFVRLYRQGLIYRDRYIVNWCPRCHTAISDLETIHQTVRGHLYRVRYPAADGSAGIEVVTTRPETMFGDVAVAVHPEDERYAPLVGSMLTLPLTDRRIPVVADPFVERDFGTGAVKITPAHDPNDFAAAKRLGLPQVVALDTAGRMTSAAGEYAGLDRHAARKETVEALRRMGLLVEVKDYEHAVGHCQRCHTMIEPLISEQWFVKVAPLAAKAIAAVEDGRIEVIPASWSKTYFEWMRNIHDWCISRQLWWGHRIPAWYCADCGKPTVARTDPTACSHCGSAKIEQDPDVLDTWFSSALWPFSTMGWPERTPELARYYPTDVLITGFDILFFWVARMIMMGLEFMDDVPFRQVYIHGLVRDAHGQKMSKSKGNTIEPSEIQKQYGTDAVRFTMAILAAPGNDIPLAHERMDGYKAFATKLWNATRFALLRLGDAPLPEIRLADLSLPDRWILSRLERTRQDITSALEEYRFDRAADSLYHFVWHEYCDWYIELVKQDLAPESAATPTRAVLAAVLADVLRLLHPFMPFVTEELWSKLPGSRGLLAAGSWPEPRHDRVDERAERDVATLQDLVVALRNLRTESRIDAARRVAVLLRTDDPDAARLASSERSRIAALMRAEDVRVVPAFEPNLVAARSVSGAWEAAIPLAGLLDLDAERARLARELDKVEREVEARERKLGNPAFLDKAPPEIVEKERAAQRESLDRAARLRSGLANLSAGE